MCVERPSVLAPITCRFVHTCRDVVQVVIPTWRSPERRTHACMYTAHVMDCSVTTVTPWLI